MMHAFLANNRDDLIARCKAKVAHRPGRVPSERQLADGIPMFLGQLIRTLEAEEAGERAEGIEISGPSGGDALALSEVGVSAAAHGANLLGLGYTVDQVVHDYGDLCQAITDLAHERDAPFTVDEFRTLNRCLDNAIADAVLEFTTQREARVLLLHSSEAKERVGFLVHELRNALSTASVAVSALEFGNLSVSGATGSVLKRSLASLGLLIDRAVSEVRQGMPSDRQVFSVASFIADAESAARLEASVAGCSLLVRPLLQAMSVRGNRPMLHAALANLLQNAFKFTHAHTEVELHAFAFDGHVLMEVHDHCGGLKLGTAENMFAPFTQRSADRRGLGLGLAIARHSVEADFGTLTVRDVPGKGCVFTIALPLHFALTTLA
ncbi:MAG: HAMP domain-containing sensor histidine kinase [Burkholderiaceae bacterium]